MNMTTTSLPTIPIVSSVPLVRNGKDWKCENLREVSSEETFHSTPLRYVIRFSFCRRSIPPEFDLANRLCLSMCINGTTALLKNSVYVFPDTKISVQDKNVQVEFKFKLLLNSYKYKDQRFVLVLHLDEPQQHIIWESDPLLVRARNTNPKTQSSKKKKRSREEDTDIKDKSTSNQINKKRKVTTTTATTRLLASSVSSDDVRDEVLSVASMNELPLIEQSNWEWMPTAVSASTNDFELDSVDDPDEFASLLLGHNALSPTQVPLFPARDRHSLRFMGSHSQGNGVDNDSVSVPPIMILHTDRPKQDGDIETDENYPNFGKHLLFGDETSPTTNNCTTPLYKFFD